jgi:hypothetical protein
MAHNHVQWPLEKLNILENNIGIEFKETGCKEEGG